MNEFEVAMKNLEELNRSELCQKHLVAFKYIMENGYYIFQLEEKKGDSYNIHQLGIYPGIKAFNKAILLVSSVLQVLKEKGCLI